MQQFIICWFSNKKYTYVAVEGNKDLGNSKSLWHMKSKF